MLQLPPAEPGMALDEVDTPALILDLDAFESNLDGMAGLAAAAGVGLRPHAKTHKSPLIALAQMRRGAVGQCVQKVGEAEVLAWGGVPDILVSNEVVAPRKLARLAALTRLCRVAVCADHPRGVAAIAAAAADAGVRMTVLMEIEVGGGRCGVAPGPDALVLARTIAENPHLKFGGLQAYHGRAQHQRGADERRASIARAADLAAGVRDDLAAIGIPCPVITGGGTGTFGFEAASGVFTELQVGSYAFMDADYARNEAPPEFRHALFVLASVMSVPRPDLAVVDAGHKALPIDSGFPIPWRRPGVTYVGASDEHGNLALANGATPLRLGETLLLVPGHCDPTVDRFDWYVGVRQGRVECLWPVAGRGAMA